MTISQRALWNLREWLTPYEAAEYLSNETGSMTDADVLRLSLDGHLCLCVNLPKPVSAELLDAKGTPTGRWTEALGLWELPMQGSARVFVEHEFSLRQRLPFIEVDWRKGANVTRAGVSCRLPGDEGASGPFWRGRSAIPYGSCLAVKLADLRIFESDHLGHKQPEQPSAAADRVDKPLGERERASLLIIIAALCKEAKIDISKPSKAAQTIAHGISQLGVEVAARTIADHLNRIPETLDRKSKTSD